MVGYQYRSTTEGSPFNTVDDSPFTTFPPEDFSFADQSPKGDLVDQIKAEEAEANVAALATTSMGEYNGQQLNDNGQGQLLRGAAENNFDFNNSQEFNSGVNMGHGWTQNQGLENIPTGINNITINDNSFDVFDVQFGPGHGSDDEGLNQLATPWEEEIFGPDQFANFDTHSEQASEMILRSAENSPGFGFSGLQRGHTNNGPSGQRGKSPFANSNNNKNQLVSLPNQQQHVASSNNQRFRSAQQPHPQLALPTPVTQPVQSKTPTLFKSFMGPVRAINSSSSNESSTLQPHDGGFNGNNSVPSDPVTPENQIIGYRSPSTTNTTPMVATPKVGTNNGGLLEPRGMKRPAGDMLPQCGRRIKKTRTYNPVPDEARYQLLQRMTALNFGNPEKLEYDNIESVKNVLEEAKALYSKPYGDCTQPGDHQSADHSFPRTAAHWQIYVRQIKMAIMDWNHYIEWMQVVDRATKEKRATELVNKIENHERMKRDFPNQIHHNALQVVDLIPQHPIQKTIEAQQSEVLGRPCNNFTAECLAWKLVEAAIESQQGKAHNLPWTTNDGA